VHTSKRVLWFWFVELALVGGGFEHFIYFFEWFEYYTCDSLSLFLFSFSASMSDGGGEGTMAGKEGTGHGQSVLLSTYWLHHGVAGE